jgi:zinc D-Ala-D-Ala dipeptidase
LKNVIVFVVIILCSYNATLAQDLKVISNKKEYKRAVDADNNSQMIDLKKLIPDISLDLRYNSSNNFMHTKLYKKANTTYLRKLPAIALYKAQLTLRKKGYGFKIYDAYRPYSVTKKMWELIHDDRYVANPAGGSGHNRGTSIDLTIIDLKTGQELDMGTAFDNFTDSAHHSFTQNFSAKIIENRNLLESLMKEIGFKRLETEWWHYSWICDVPYPVLDFDFKTMRKLSNYDVSNKVIESNILSLLLTP